MIRPLAFVMPLVCGTPALFGMPVLFEENRGQAPPEAAFVARASGYHLFLTRRGAVITLQNGQTVRMNLANSIHNAPDGTHRLLAKSNYLAGAESITGIPNYEGVTYPQVYPGIDMAWHPHGSQIEHDFLVAAGADPHRIRLAFTGSPLRLNAEGDLTAGSLRFPKPHAYQGQREIECRFEIHGSSVTFALGGYDRWRPLTIDPLLTFSSFFGSSANGALGGASATALDNAGNVYVAGQTQALNSPVTTGALQPKPGAGLCKSQEPFGGASAAPCYAIFVAKFSPDGKTLLYATYLGGGGPVDTRAKAIAVGPGGNLFLAGTGSLNASLAMPSPAGAPSAPPSFVVVLSADGSSLLQGAAVAAIPNALAVDAAGAVYLTGSTESGLPTVNAFQPKVAGPLDAFVMKLDPAFSELVYSTYLGGSGADAGAAIAVDAAGRAYVTGQTDSADFPLASPLQSTLGGQSDAFVTVLDPSGSHLAWSTFQGGSGLEAGVSIAVDAAGDVHLAASVSMSISGSTVYSLITKIKGDGSRQIFSTTLGDSHGVRIAADTAGNTYFADWTSSSTRPTPNGLQPAFGGASDVYAAEFSGRDGSLQFATYLGGSGNEYLAGMATDAGGDFSLVGQTFSSDMPLKNAWQTAAGDIFVAKIGAGLRVDGITNAASYATTAVPGELVSIFGALAANTASAAQPPLPLQLSDVQVTVNGVSAPLIYVSPLQVNAQIPFETQAGTAQLQVTTGAGTLTTPVPVAAIAPAIFSLNGQGTGPGAILNAVTNQVVSTANPAAAGDFVSIYCTGLGAVDPPAETGAAPAGPAQTVIPVEVSIGAAAAQVVYAGVAPGFAGLYQVNAQIPSGLAAGPQPLQIVQNGITSNTVTIVIGSP